MNIIVLLGIIVSSGVLGFSFRSKQIKKNHSRVMRLESEMISNHAEILELQKEYLAMELKLRGVQEPVIAVRKAPRELVSEKLPDVSMRKKLLNKNKDNAAAARTEDYQVLYDSLSAETEKATAEY